MTSPAWSKACSTEHGRIDVLVNNVGDYRPLVPFHRSTPDSWQQMYDVNLRHVFAVTRAFVPSMIDAHRGSIVTVHSVEGMRGYPKDPVYGAMKAAAAHFTTCLAVDLGRHGIRVNGIGTDLAQTPQVDYLTGYEDVDELWASWAPVGRRGLARGPGARRTVSRLRPVRVRHRAQHPRRRWHESRWRMALLTAGRPLRQPLEAPVNAPDETVDVLVAGSGGGIAGAYTAAREGLRWRSSRPPTEFGGTFAYSGGGGMWFPCNPVLVRAGGDDTIEAALRYYRSVVGHRTPADLQETYVRGGAALIEYLERDERFAFKVLPWPDYYSSVAGPGPTACATLSRKRCPTTALADSRAWFVVRWITNASARRAPTC